MRRSLIPMKREIAERLAATAVEGVTVKDAQTIIETFLTELASCPVCDGSGRTTFVHGVDIAAAEQSGKQLGIVNVLPGTEGSCPRCGSYKAEDNGHGDPEFVAWHCAHDKTKSDCRKMQTADQNGERAKHAACGFRVVLCFTPKSNPGP